MSMRAVPARAHGHSAVVGWDRELGGYFWALYDVPDGLRSDVEAVAYGGGTGTDERTLLTVDELIEDSETAIVWAGQERVIAQLLDDPYGPDRRARPDVRALVDRARRFAA